MITKKQVVTEKGYVRTERSLWPIWWIYDRVTYPAVHKDDAYTYFKIGWRRKNRYRTYVPHFTSELPVPIDWSKFETDYKLNRYIVPVNFTVEHFYQKDGKLKPEYQSKKEAYEISNRLKKITV